MRMLLLGTLIGVAIASFFMYLYKKLMTYFRNKFCSPRWYPVVSFNTQPESDGTYPVFFSIAEGDVHKGYTKKCPPTNVTPDELVVTVKKFHEGRVAYRVFWKLKE